MSIKGKDGLKYPGSLLPAMKKLIANTTERIVIT